MHQGENYSYAQTQNWAESIAEIDKTCTKYHQWQKTFFIQTIQHNSRYTYKFIRQIKQCKPNY